MERVSIVGSQRATRAALRSMIRLSVVYATVLLLTGLSLTFFASGNVAQAANAAGSDGQAISPMPQTSQASRMSPFE